MNVHLEPGIYRNVSYNEYASWPAVRASTLNACFRSMAHGRYNELHPRADTRDLAFGTNFHALMLEPDRFFAETRMIPKFDKRTKEGKEAWAAFESQNDDRPTITQADLDTARQMISSVMQCRDAAEIFASAKAKELSIVWQDDETGAFCKARIDLVSVLYGSTMIVDLKSAKDVSKLAFRKQSESLGYYRALAWYRWGLDTIVPCHREAAFLAVEKTPPYCAAVYRLTESALEHGLAEMRVMLRRYLAARESGDWPGYGDDVQDMDLSHWLRNDLGFS